METSLSFSSSSWTLLGRSVLELTLPAGAERSHSSQAALRLHGDHTNSQVTCHPFSGSAGSLDQNLPATDGCWVLLDRFLARRRRDLADKSARLTTWVESCRLSW